MNKAAARVTVVGCLVAIIWGGYSIVENGYMYGTENVNSITAGVKAEKPLLGVKTAAFQGKDNLAVAHDNKVSFFDSETGKQTGEYDDSPKAITGLTFSGNKAYVVGVSKGSRDTNWTLTVCDKSFHDCQDKKSGGAYYATAYDSDNNLLWVYSGSVQILGLDPDTLEEKKKISTDNYSLIRDEILDMEYANGRVWVLTTKHLLGYDVNTGKKVWKKSLQPVLEQYKNDSPANETPSNPNVLAYDGDSFWVSGDGWTQPYRFKVS